MLQSGRDDRVPGRIQAKMEEVSSPTETAQMPGPIMRLIRGSLLLLFLLTGIAVLVSRLTRPDEGREFGGPPMIQVSNYLVRSTASELTLLDAGEGTLKRLDLDRRSGLDSFSVSPWRDLWGERHLAGRWCKKTGREADTLFEAFGLGRVAYPSGRLIDEAPSDVFPVSPPCWFPETAARILFPAADGLLYTYSFEESRKGDSTGDYKNARSLRWEIAGEARAPGLVKDVTWGGVGEEGRLVVASVTRYQEARLAGRPSRSEIWWFALDEQGTRVVEGGPMLPSGGGEEMKGLRRPTVGKSWDGGNLLACLEEGETGRLNLVVFPIRREPGERGWRVSSTKAERLAEDCALVSPAFSEDGKWLIFARMGRGASPVSVERARLRSPGPWSTVALLLPRRPG